MRIPIKQLLAIIYGLEAMPVSCKCCNNAISDIQNAGLEITKDKMEFVCSLCMELGK